MGEATSAKDIRAKARKQVTGMSGNVYEIRRLSVFGLASALGNIPDLMAIIEGLKEAKPQKGQKQDLNSMQKHGSLIQEKMGGVVTKGLVSPAIGEDGLEISDIPFEDVAELFTEILALSGFTKEASEELVPSSAATGAVS